MTTNKQPGCKAVQHSDQMQCDYCALQWDVNDPEPPECARRPRGAVHGRHVGRTAELPDSLRTCVHVRLGETETVIAEDAAEKRVPFTEAMRLRRFEALERELAGQLEDRAVAAAARNERTGGRFRVVVEDTETGRQGVGFGATVRDATASANVDMARRAIR